MKITPELRRVIESTFPERHHFTGDREKELIAQATQEDGRIVVLREELGRAYATVAQLEKRLSEIGLSMSERTGELDIRDAAQFRSVYSFAPAVITRKMVYTQLAHRNYQDGVAYLASIGINWESK